MSNALIRIPVKAIFTYYDLGIVIPYGKQIPEFPIDHCLAVQAEGYLDI